jgi:hypothetical protein
MKKIAVLIFSLLMIVLMLSGCGGKADSPDETTTASSANTAEVVEDMPTILNTAEYTLYQNIFYNDMKSDYNGKEAVKEGTFATITDAFNNTTRYYVWGYNDQTKCCDWQWEIKIDDTSDLPKNGCLVQVKGTYEENEAALDKFWIINPEITVEKAFDGRDCDIDMQAMDNTLERVQCANIVNKKESFEGKTVKCYGRILNETTLQDPYNDNSWTIEIAGDFEVPAFGTLVEVSGVIQDGKLVNCEVSESSNY